MDSGIHCFNNVGPATIFTYDEHYEVTDSTTYQKGDFFNIYHGLRTTTGSQLSPE